MEDLQIKMSQAVYILNHDTQPSNRLAANEWLVQFQQTDSVWEVATSILTSATNPDFELLFFAAHTLKRKIQREGRRVSLALKDALFHSLLVAAKRFSSNCPQLLTQICLALTALMLQTVDHGKPIDHLFHRLRALQSEVGGDGVVLEILTVLPEEVSDTSDNDAKISVAQRSLYAQEILSHTPAVFEFLIEDSMQPCHDSFQSSERKRKILRCFLSWVRAGCFSEISKSSLEAHQVLNLVFTSLPDPALFDLAIEVLVELVNYHEEFCQVMLCRVPYLQEKLLLPASCDGNDSVVYGLAYLLSELGHAAPSLAFKSSLETLELFEALLRCIAFPSSEWRIADVTLQFWSALANHISGLGTNDRQITDHVGKIFHPMFVTLLETLLQRVQVDEGTFNMKIGDIELPDGLEQFRMNLVETFLDICLFLKPETFMEKISFANCMNANASLSWREVEAKLFVLNVVADVVRHEAQTFDFSLVMHLVIILSSTPYDELKGFMGIVHKTLAEVIGSYSKWILSSQIDPIPLLKFLAAGIAVSHSSTSYASSLRKLCEEASVKFCKPQYLEFLLWMGEDVEKKLLPPESEEDIVSAIITVVGSVTDSSLKNSLVIRFLTSSYNAISKLTDERTKQFIRENPASYSHIFDAALRGLSRIGTAIRHLASPQPSSGTDEITCVLLRTLWPLLEKLFRSEYAKNSILSIAACRALSLATLSSGQHLVTLLPEILDTLSTSFLENQTYDCYIRTAMVVMEDHRCNSEYGPLFISTFERFTTASVLSALTTYTCDQEPDLVEAYTNFASAFVGGCNKEILARSGPVLELSFQRATLCCPAMHRGAALAALTYLSCFLEVGLASLVTSDSSFGPVAVHIISRGGDRLLSHLVCALLGVTAVSRVQKCAAILQQIGAVCYFCEQTSWKPILGWTSLLNWLEAAFQLIPSEHQRCAQRFKIQWIEALVEAASDYAQSKKRHAQAMNLEHMPKKSARTLKRVVRQFADNVRNFAYVK